MLDSLEVRDFRNLEAARIELGGGSHLILGRNGAGKTSLLEAIYVLATTRSFRTSRLSECARHGEPGFFLSGETDGRAQLEMGWLDGETRRRVNGNRSSLAEHLGCQAVVAWTTAELEILIGPPGARRRFLDRGVVGLRPAALATLARYRQGLLEKRRLLQSQDLVGPKQQARELVRPWNLVLAEAAADLAEKRSEYVRLLSQALVEILRSCELDLPSLELAYKPSPRQALEGPEAVFDALESTFERELLSGKPALGPHRDELEIQWAGRAVRQVASAGERKAVGLALVAAHGRVLENKGIDPIYLLDDVDIELDAQRLAGLWRHFGEARQLLASSNRPAIWEGLGIDRRSRCSNGRLGPMDG